MLQAAERHRRRRQRTRPGPWKRSLRRAIATSGGAIRRRLRPRDRRCWSGHRAIAAAVLGLVEPGSEVLIEPFCDSSPVVAMAGAHHRWCPMAAGFALNADAPTRSDPNSGADRNSPHNPTGAVLKPRRNSQLAGSQWRRTLWCSPTRCTST